MARSIEIEPRTFVEIANDSEISAQVRDLEAHAYELGIQAGRLLRPSLPRRVARDFRSIAWDVIAGIAAAGLLFGVASGFTVLGFRLVIRIFG